jgi:hypothetical protein
MANFLETVIRIFYFLLFCLFVDHPWLQNAKKAPNVPLGDIVRTRLRQFSVMNRFKKKALRVRILGLIVSSSSNYNSSGVQCVNFGG